MITFWKRLDARHRTLVRGAAAAGTIISAFGVLGADYTAPVRGAVFASCLAFGVTAVNHANRDRLGASRPPTLPASLIAGAAAGLIAGLVGWVCLQLVWPPFYPKAARSLAWVMVPIGVVSGTVFLATYSLRWRFRTGRTAAMIACLSVASLLCGTLRPAVIVQAKTDVEWLTLALLVGLFAAPFGALWVYVMKKLDPAWSLERWQEWNMSAPTQPSPTSAGAANSRLGEPGHAA